MAAWNDDSGFGTAPGKRLSEDRAERLGKGKIEAGSRCITLRRSSSWQRVTIGAQRRWQNNLCDGSGVAMCWVGKTNRESANEKWRGRWRSRVFT
jgi:hypothetical protein